MDGLKLDRPKTRTIRDSTYRDPRTAESVRIFKEGWRDQRNVESVQILKKGCGDP